MIKQLSADALLLFINYYKKYSTENIYRISTRKGNECIRVYNAVLELENKEHEYRLSTQQGRELLKLCEEYDKNHQLYIRALNEWRARYNCTPPQIDTEAVKTAVSHSQFWSSTYYNELTAEQNTAFAQSKALTYNGILFRSKSEILIAKTLDNLNIGYKYEPAVNLSSDVVYPDFVPNIHWLFACFPLEHFGRIGQDNSYTDDITTKLRKYARAGMLPGNNFAYTTESDIFPLNADKIEEEIVFMINNIASRILNQCLQSES